jgi:hypothetical protein
MLTPEKKAEYTLIRAILQQLKTLSLCEAKYILEECKLHLNTMVYHQTVQDLPDYLKGMKRLDEVLDTPAENQA